MLSTYRELVSAGVSSKAEGAYPTDALGPWSLFLVGPELFIYFCCFVCIILVILCSLLYVSVFYGDILIPYTTKRNKKEQKTKNNTTELNKTIRRIEL